jgi:hypothetical protein
VAADRKFGSEVAERPQPLGTGGARSFFWLWSTSSAHKVTGVREAIEATGAVLLYLPPYSPDLNPIEQLFAKLRALLRNSKPPNEPSRPSGVFSTTSRPRSARAILPTMDVARSKWKRL